MKRTMCLALGATLALATAACGGDDVNHVDNPAPIPGGGLGEGAVKGELNVFVVDGDDDAPIAGATVRVGAAAAAMPLTGTTDATGLVIFEDGSLSGPQEITVTASGYAAATWIGANGALVTIPMDSTADATFDQAHVEGTIAGWDAIPDPPSQHYLLGFVGYTATKELGAPENEITQPSSMGFPQNLCARIPGLVDQCAWKLETRTGAQRIWAVILDGDSKGTPTNQGDDTYTVIGYAFSDSMTLTADQSVTGETLTQVAAGDLTDITVMFQTPPTGLGTVQGIPLLDLGDDGQALIFFAVTDLQTTTATVPSLTGDLAGASYDFVARAVPDEMTEVPVSMKILRDVNIAMPIDVGAWLPTPTNVAAAAGTYSFTPAAGATLHTAEFLDTDGDVAWNVALLDGSSSFTLPALTPDALPAGMVELQVSAVELPNFDVTNFSLDGLEDVLTRLAENTATFSH